MKIQLLGCGNMGKIILKQLLSTQDKKDIWVETSSSNSKQELYSEFGIQTWVYSEVDVVLLLIKPQQLWNIDFTVFDYSQSYVSFLAWTTTGQIEEITGSSSVLRIMPNMALSVWEWLIGYYSKNLTNDFKFFLGLFNGVAKTIDCQNEEIIDNFTVLAGSGAAYYYYFAQLLEKQAIEFGFWAEDSKNITYDTFIGAAAILRSEWSSLDSWIKDISSKWWVTEKVLGEFYAKGLNEVISASLGSWLNHAKTFSKN